MNRRTPSHKKKVRGPEEVRIPIKPATARNLMALNTALEKAQAEVDGILNRVHDSLRPLYTENGIEQGRCLEVTEKAPYELVVVVLKRAKEE